MLRAWLGAGQGIIEGARGGGVGDKRRRILENGGAVWWQFQKETTCQFEPSS